MDYAQQLAFFANILEQKRLVTALEGNASMIDRNAGLTYITPSGRMKLLLQKEDISVMGENGTQVGGRGKRSSEYLLHEAVYRTRPDVNAVVHCHCPYLTAYALRYQDFIVPENCSLHAVFRRFVCLPYGKNGTHEIHRQPSLSARRTRRCMREQFHGKLYRAAGSSGGAGKDTVAGGADLGICRGRCQHRPVRRLRPRRRFS